jgi:acylphosphatase
MRAVEISVRGKVQGVYFRASTKEFALQNKINGFCRNELDGSVSIYAEGDSKQLESLIDWCHLGPDMANVEEVIFNETKLLNVESFVIMK